MNCRIPRTLWVLLVLGSRPHISSLHVPIVFLTNQSKQRVDNFGQSPTTAASSPIMIVWGVLKLVEQSLNKFAHAFLTAVTKVHFLLQQEPQLLGDGCRPSLHSWLGPQIEKLMISYRVGGEKLHKLSQDDPTCEGLPSVNWESAYLPHSSPFIPIHQSLVQGFGKWFLILLDCDNMTVLPIWHRNISERQVLTARHMRRDPPPRWRKTWQSRSWVEEFSQFSMDLMVVY